ncbi:tripartite tricarboxylate transporter substrate binding protein [soil metagenome]
MHRRHFNSALAAALALGPLGARAQQTTPVRLLVGATPGGGTDIVARALALELSKRLNRQFIVDNRPGAAGNIAANSTAKATPDGTTLLLSYTSHAINATLYPTLPFDPVADFTPISEIASQPAFLIATNSLKANNVRELIALGKAQPGKLNIAIAGLGSANHLGGEMLKLDAGIDMVSVPYKGTGPVIADVLAGQIELGFAGIASAQALVKSGKLKVLGVSSGKRLAAYPDIPAIAETVPGYEWSSWYGLFGPAKMDKAAVTSLSTAVRESLGSAEMKERFDSDGLVAVGSSPDEFAAFVKSEIARWGKVVKASGAKPE